MADVNITGKIQVDADAALKQTLILKQEIKDLSTEFKNAKAGSDEQVTAYKKLSQAQKELSDRTGEGSGAFSILKDKINHIVPGFKGAQEGASSFGKQLLVLAVNPIILILTAIVGALTILYKAFASTEEGADRLSFIMDGIGKVIELVRDRILKVAGAISKLISGDFKGAMEEGKAAVSGFGEQAKQEFNKAYQAAQKLDEIADKMDELAVSRSRLNAQIAAAREKMNDETASIEDRKKALKEVSEAEQQQSEAELKAAKDKLDQLNIMHGEQKKNNTLNEQQRKELQAAESAYYSADEASQQTRFRLNKMNNSIRRVEVEAWNTMFLNQQQKEKEALANLYKAQLDEYNNRKKLRDTEKGEVINYYAELKKAQKEEEDRKKRGEELIQKFNKESNESGLGALLAIKAKETVARWNAADSQKAADKSIIENKELLLQKEIELAFQVSDLIGRQTAIGKGLAVAAATVNTYLAASKAVSADYTSFGPAAFAARIVATASTIALGLQQVKSILAVPVPGQGGGGSVASGGSNIAAPVLPTQSSTNLNASAIQGIGNAATGGVVRAFVVENDVTNNQQRIATLNRAARLG